MQLKKIMTSPITFSLFGADAFMKDLDRGLLTFHRFPDGESYIRFDESLEGREVVFIDTLSQPDSKILPLLFAARTAKEMGAVRVGLVAPYLAYMRQDTRFKPGEAITSIHFAHLISEAFDWLVTVDPHLHRYKTLSEIYSIPTQVVTATQPISQWIHGHVDQPVLIGPDSESAQWVAQIAAEIGAPFLVLEKTRYSDQDVKVSIPALEKYSFHTPILIDDIISTGQTMIETIKHLKSLRTKPPVCIGVHAVFAGITTETLIEAGAAKVVTCNTISHDSNGIDVFPLLFQGVKSLMQGFT